MTTEEKLAYSKPYPHIAHAIVKGTDVPSTRSDIFSFGKLMQYIEERSSMDMKALVNYSAYNFFPKKALNFKMEAHFITSVYGLNKTLQLIIDLEGCTLRKPISSYSII